MATIQYGGTGSNTPLSTVTTHTSNGSAGPYAINFDYNLPTDIDVRVAGVLKTRNTHYTLTSTTQITFTSGNLPANGAIITFTRNTNITAPPVTFTDGGVLTSEDLNESFTSLFNGMQEIVFDFVKRDGSQGVTGNLVFEGSTDDDHETTLAITDPTQDNTITLPDVTGTVVTTGDTGTVTSAMITDGTIVNADVNASAAIDGSKVNPNFGGQTIATTGSSNIGANLAVTGNTTVGGTLGVTGASTFTGAIDANGGASIDNIQIGVTGDNEIDTASGNLTIDSAGGTTTIDDALTVSGNATLQGTLGVTGNTTVGGTLGVTGTSTLADVTGGAVVTSGTSTSDTKVYSAKRAGEIFYGKNTAEEIQSGETWTSADNKVATTAAIDARIIDFVDDVGGFNAIANETSFPATNPQGSAGQAALLSIAAVSTTLTPSSNTITIANGAGTGNTVTINSVTPASIPQGFGLIVESTSTLHTYTFHRLVPKATEVTTVAGNIANINTVAGISANVTTVAGISANVTSVAGNASNINSAVSNASNINSAVSNASNINSVVSNATNINTVANSISNVNTVGGSIASVNTASANISSIANFGDQYQVASSNPSTDGGGNSLAAGDLYFNTTANELKVYNGSAWQGGVTASGNFASVTGNNFTGDNVYADNAKAIFGTGQDLKIHHTSNQSTIEEVNGSLNITSNGALSFNPSGSNVVTLVGNYTKGSGQIKLNCELNTHGVILKGPPHSAAASYTLTLPNNIVNGQFLTTDANGNTSWSAVDLTSLSATNLTSGTIPDARFPATLPAISGANLTNLDAADLASGTIPAARFGTDTIATDSLAAGALPTDVTVGSANIQNNAVTVSKLELGTAAPNGTAGKFLRANNGAAPSFEDIPATQSLTYPNGSTAVSCSTNNEIQINNSNSKIVFDTDTNNTNQISFAGPSTLTKNSDYTLPEDGSANQFLKTDGSGVLSFATPDLHLDTTPQLGGILQTSGYSIVFGDSSGADDDRARFGSSFDMEIYHDGGHSHIINDTGNLNIKNNADSHAINLLHGNDYMLQANADGSVDLYHSGNKKLETSSTGVSITGALVASGDVTAFSDAKLKTEISTINDALSTVGKLRGVSYKWLKDNKPSIGVIAQEVEEIIPEVVHTNQLDGEDVKSVDYGKLVGVLIEAIKELKAEVDELKGVK